MNASNQPTLIASVSLVLVLAGFGLWVLAFSQPGTSEIAAKRQPPTPLPTIAIDQLAQQAGTRQVFGPLPIDTAALGVGKQDPFTGQ